MVLLVELRGARRSAARAGRPRDGPSVLRLFKGVQRGDAEGLALLDPRHRAKATNGLAHAAGDVHGRGHGGALTDRPDLVGGAHRDPADLDAVRHVGEVGARDDTDVADLDGLGPGGPQLLEGVEQKRARDRLVGVVDGQHDAWALGRDRPREDPQGVEPLLGRAQSLCAAVGPAEQTVAGDLQGSGVVAEPGRVLRDVVEDADQLVLAKLLQPLLLGLLDLRGKGEPQGQRECCGEEIRAGRPRPRHPEHHAPRAALGRRLRCRRCLGGWLLAHARKRCRRIEATLEKMRTPRTTTTPVDSWEPTPSWSPRKTMKPATTTLARKETTKTLSLKIPSSTARTAPNTASRAAMTAMGRYGCSHSGTSGCRKSPIRMPPMRPRTGITVLAPSWSGSGRRCWECLWCWVFRWVAGWPSS